MHRPHPIPPGRHGGGDRRSTSHAASCATFRGLVPAAAAGLLGLAAAPAALAGDDCGTFETQPVPAYVGAGLLYGVAVAPDGSVFVAGRSDKPVGSGTDGWPHLARLEDGAFVNVPLEHPSPLPVGMEEAALYDVAALSATEAWAVGTYNRQHVDGFVGFQTLALHLTESGWQQVDTPLTPVGGTGAALMDVEAYAPDDVWACGWRVATEVVNTDTVALLLHWDGSSWTELPTPPVLGDMQIFEDLVKLPSGDVWCVGAYGPTFSSFPYVCRWDGSDWTLYEGLPVPPGLNSLTGVDAAGANDIWMAGRSTTTTGGQALVLRWNGSFFENRTPQDLSLLSVRLEDLEVTPSGDVVAVGSGTEVPPPAVPIAITVRHDGTAWSEMTLDPAGPASSWLRCLDVVGDCEMWTVGQQNPFAPHAQVLAPASSDPDPDLDGDGSVGLSDVLVILSSWGGCDGTACPADLDGDGLVGLGDVLVVLAAWS